MIDSLYGFARRWSETGSVWLYSDPHFGDPDQKLMDKNWLPDDEQAEILRRCCNKTDTLVILGDIGNPEYLSKLRCYLVCVLGNHDRGKSYYRDYFDEIYDGPIFIGDRILLSHEPVDLPFCFNIHGHCHGGEMLTENHLNVAADVIGYKPVSLGKVIKSGVLKGIPTIHRLAIDKQAKSATSKSSKSQ